MPPISACEDDDGTPNHHVTRFQAIAPTRPAKITVVVTTPASTIPLATVAATVIEMNAPTKFRIAATPTATFGFSAPVAMVVAIALAVSWKPFVKSNTSATATTSTTMMSPVTITTLRPGPVYPAGSVYISATCLLIGPRVLSAPMADDAITETRARLEARLAELAPAVEEAAKIKAALAALNGGPRPPVTALDALKPSFRPRDET